MVLGGTNESSVCNCVIENVVYDSAYHEPCCSEYCVYTNEYNAYLEILFDKWSDE